MTPTEHAAVAEAIAALEEAERFANSAKAVRFLYNDRRELLPKLCSALANLRRLASLRAVDPAPAESKWHPGFIRAMTAAPADQSDAGRDGVIEECAIEINYARYFPDGANHAPHPQVKKTAIEQWQVEGRSGKSYARKLAHAAIRALAPAPSEAPHNLDDEFRGETFETVSGPAWDLPSEASKPPGQEPGGDPGVGRVELETEVEELRALVGKLNGGAEMQELMRLNNGLADKVRNLTALLDQQLGTPCEEIRHAQEVEKLQALSLPTADRDAIREALKPFASMICLVDDKDPSKGSAFDRWHPDHVVFDIGSDRKITVGDLRRATAALTLIGEG